MLDLSPQFDSEEQKGNFVGFSLLKMDNYFGTSKNQIVNKQDWMGGGTFY